MQQKRSLLLIEDDLSIQEIVRENLVAAGYAVECSSDGTTGMEQARSAHIDMVLLDINLPGDRDGFDVCRELRHLRPGLPIIMLTARTDEIDKVLGIEIGADDYLTKPFSMRELVARVRALFRRIDVLNRPTPEQGNGEIAVGGLVINPEKRTVVLNGVDVALTVKEFELLYLLVSNPGKTFTRRYLLERIWETDFEGYDRAIDSHIKRLRAKIEDSRLSPTLIHTVWGVGYRFADYSEGR